MRSAVYPWIVLTTCVIVFMVAVASHLASVSPSVPVIMETFGVSTATAGLMTSAWALARALIAIPAGSFITRFGCRVAYVIGVLLSALGWLIKALSPNYPIMLLGRFVMGFGAGITSVTIPVVISEWFPRGLISTAMGVWSTAMPLGVLWGLPLTAWLISGLGVRVAYMAFAAASALMLIPLAVVLRGVPPNPLVVGGGPEGPRLGNLVRNRQFMAACASIFLGMGLWGAYSTYIVRWCMVKGLDYMTASYVGTLLMLGCTIFEVVTGYVSDRVLGGRQRPAFIAGTLLASVLTVAFIFSDSLSEISLIAFIAGAGMAPVTVAMFVIPIRTVGAGERGLAMGLTGVFIYAAYTLTYLVGYLDDAYGLLAACAVASSVGFLSALVMGLYVRSQV